MSRAPTEPSVSRAGDSGKRLDPAIVDEVCLTNGRYTVHLDSHGGGSSEWGRIAVTRWSLDRICRTDGFHIYLRELDTNSVWSSGFQPTRVEPDEYQFFSADGAAEIRRVDAELECTLCVHVAAEHDCELRRCHFTNHARHARRIELTSYLEWVLGAREADLNHPAFSKLFIETQFHREHRAIVARRRPRSSDDPQIWGLHWLVTDDASEQSPAIEHETSRVAFIGRGRTLQRPRAMHPSVSLTGQTGPVLDPIGSLRIVLSLEPGETRACAFLLGVGQESESFTGLLNAFTKWSDVDSEFDRAALTRNSGNGASTANLGRERPGRANERIIIHGPHSAPQSSVATFNVSREFQQASRQSPDPVSASVSFRETLQFDNGYGGFSVDGSEYVVRLQPDGNGRHSRPPMPWVNVIANEHAGFTVSESGAGCTWCGNSRLNRLTAWHNDPVCDPHSEVIWIRDENAAQFWSVTPGPTPSPAEYVVRHGFGYTRFEHEFRELSHDTTMFMAPNEPVKIVRLRLVNRSSHSRRLSVFSYAHWLLGGLTSETARLVSTAYDAQLRAILATNASREYYGGNLAFCAVAASNVSCQVDAEYTCDRGEFIGSLCDMTAPEALSSSRELGRCTGSGLDSCAAWRVPVELKPGVTCEVIVLLGETTSHAKAAELIDKYRSAERVQQALEAVEEFWRRTVSAVEIETPDREIDLMVNGWLTYQNLSCRMWARSAYYQPGGAYGFRDQLQDSAALAFVRPEITRTQIRRHASQQFVEGDVLHWWHEDTGYGLRTRFSDDLLWLPYVTVWYVEKTGDEAFLNEVAPFIIGPELGQDHVENYLCPDVALEQATIYEHCCRTLDRGLTTGAHGLPLIGCGDWNDGFSRVGRLGRGESVWLGFFIHVVLGHFLPICAARGDDERVARYSLYRERLVTALNTHGWDGQWYRRAYYDNGQPLGSAQSDECQIDALAQAWAVLSGVASPERARTAMDAVMNRLVARGAGIIKLLTPPFNRTPNDPGYIKGYVPGIRENGGQYTHGVLWVIKALAEMGEGSTAVELLRMLTPVWHTATRERVDVYQTEPFVVAADIYGEPPHAGRGGWTWYTGSAGWMFRVAVESIFGLSIDRGQSLVVKPAISAAWPRCRLKYRLPGEDTCYDIQIENPHGRQTGVTSASVDGREIAIEHDAARIPIDRDGQLHRVLLTL
jgi:cyclic beta-1,2-glucan synthetase